MRLPPQKGPPHTFSFIRTMTVGSGISPDLLDLACLVKGAQALAGSWITDRLGPHTAGGELRPALRMFARCQFAVGCAISKMSI
jgi:hypothetical protein